MGAIRGDLSVLSIANLVQALVLDRSYGRLTVESGTDRRVLRVAPTGIRLIRGSQRCHRLERLLRRLGRTSPDPSDFFSMRVARLVRDWMLEEICELFTWTRGVFTFEKADPGRPLEEGPFGSFAADCDVTGIALEAARWADELPRIKATIPDLRRVPVMVAPPVSPRECGDDPEAVEEVLRLIDGTRPVIQILQLSLFPRYLVLQLLHRLSQKGVIRVQAPPPREETASILPQAA